MRVAFSRPRCRSLTKLRASGADRSGQRKISRCKSTSMIHSAATLYLLYLAAGLVVAGASGQQDDFALAQDEQLQEELALETPVNKSCVPMFDLAAHLQLGANQTAQERPPGKQQSFSFAIGDIELSLAPKESSIGSAMKLLSSLNSQLDPTEPNAGPSEPENAVKFWENRLQIQGLNLSMLDVHLYTSEEPKFGVGVTIRNTTLSGRFAYHGPLAWSEGRLAGFYRMSIENVYLVASSNLSRALESNEAAAAMALRTNDFRLNITNLGYISIDILDSRDASRPSSSYLLRMLQRVLQKTIKRTYYSFESYIRETLEREARRSIDCELTRFSPALAESQPSKGGRQADLARILNAEIARSQLASVPLPSFEHQQSILGSQASVQFTNGTLIGLNHVHLDGETRIKLQEEHLFVNTSIGWTELKPYYNWSLFLGGNGTSDGANQRQPTARGFVAFNIKGIYFDAVITKGLRPHTRLLVDQLLIRQLDSPKMDIGGLPGLNRLTRGMVNFFMGRLKQRLASSVQPALKQQLERSLNRLSWFRPAELTR